MQRFGLRDPAHTLQARTPRTAFVPGAAGSSRCPGPALLCNAELVFSHAFAVYDQRVIIRTLGMSRQARFEHGR